MNTQTKIAVGLAGVAAATLAVLGLRKKNIQKVFTAPDGTSYAEGQTYRDKDNRSYKNGKEVKHEKPEEHFVDNSTHSFSQQNHDPSGKNYNGGNQNVQYHQRGVRHR